MKVGVLGGEGFVGSAFVRYCEREGIGCDVIEPDNYVEYSGREYDLLINAAGESRKYQVNRDPAGDLDYSLKPLLRSFNDFSCGRYVYISSIDLYSDHADPARNREDAALEIDRISHYGFHKFLGEKIVEHYLSSWLVIRLGGVLGPGLKKNPVFDILHDQPLRVHQESRYQYLDTDTAAAAVFELHSRGIEGEIFNLCGKGTVSLREISSWLEKSPRYLDSDPPREVYEVNNEKISRFYPIPESRITAQEFVRSAEGGRT